MASNIIIENPTIKQLRAIKVQLEDIKDNLKANQTLVITLDTETTGKYYNSYQAEQDKAGIVDKIIEIGAIFSIKETQADGLESFIPISDSNNAEKDLGFRSFFNPFIDGIKGFHKSMPLGAYEVHQTSREFLEAKGTIPNSFEKLKKPSPSLQKEYTIDGEKTTYIKEIMSLININDDFIAHNAPFDLGMINEAVKDQNDKIRESDVENKDYVPYYKNNVVDTLAIFRETYPRHRLIARQGIHSPSKVSHKLDYMMEITGQKERDVHGAYWDSKLLIDSYSEFYKEFLEDDILRDIMIKKTNYLLNFDISYPNGEPIKSMDFQLQSLFKETLHNSDFLSDNDIRTHLKNQLDNINSKKRNEVTQNQISNSLIYFKILMHENRNIETLKELEEKFSKIKTFGNEKLLEGMKKSKIFSSNDIANFQSSLTDAPMSHYLTQAIFNFYKDKLEREVFNPFVRQKHEMISELESNSTVSVSKEQTLHYFRTDGSIATKDHSSTTIIGSVSDYELLLKESADEGVTHLNYLDFNSIVNYLNFQKVLKEFNENRDEPITVNYGYTTLLRIDDVDVEVNIIAKNEKALKEIPPLVSKTYNNDYKDPHFTLEQFSKLNPDDYFVTTGSYAGIVEKVIFNGNIPHKEKYEKIISLFSSILENTDTLNVEIYESDTFLYDYKKNIVKSLKEIYPNSNIELVFTAPKLYNKGDRDYHKVRCSKYDEDYDLNNLDLIENFSIKNENNPEFITPKNMESCETIPKDPVIVPGLITDLEFIKERRKDIYKELETLKDEDENLFNLNDNSKENVTNIQLQYFRLKAREGLDLRFEENNTPLEAQEHYNKRFDFEMEIIEKMKFDGYTLLVDDFLKTLEGTIGGLTGPGRGSAAGSLVSYGFKITEVDPMLEYESPEKHLLFERYLNPERVSLPDVDMDMHGMIRIDALIENIESSEGNIKMYDIDIADNKKTKTIENFLEIIKNKYEEDEEVNGKSLLEDYQVALWGNEKVAKIVTRDTYQAKSAIASVCRYLGNDFARSTDFKFNPGDTPYTELAKKISGNAFEKVSASFKKVFDEKHELYNKHLVDLYNTNPNVKKIVDLAWKLEGTIANYGIHAAGLVLLDRENNYMNRGYMNIGGVNVTLLDNKYVEDYINIKFDFLGLASLEEIYKTVQFIRQTKGVEEANKVLKILENEQILYSDKETFETIFDTQNTVKIFQFSSDGMQDLVKRVKPDSFEDLVAITALYRPGPMESGMTDQYVKNKHNPDNIFYAFEEQRDVLEFTYGSCLIGKSLITTKNGKNKEIKEIVDNNDLGLEVLTFNESTKKLEYKEVTKTFNQGVKRVLKICTKNGYEIEATEDHKILTDKGWLELKDINNKHLLLLPKNMKNHSDKSVDKNKLLILAYLLADGYLAKSSISFINKDKILLNNFKKAISENFKNLKIHETLKKNNVIDLMITTLNRKSYHSNDLINWIKELGLFHKRSHEKFIPEFIFELSEEYILYFLAKYWECDGHISKNGCHIKTISNDMAYSIQKLLLKVGISSSVRFYKYNNNIRKNRIAYTVSIQQNHFNLINKYMTSSKKDVKHNREFLGYVAPIDFNDIKDYIKTKLKEKNISLRKMYIETGVSRNIFSKNRTVVYTKTLQRINSLINDDFIGDIINSDVYGTRIKSIETIGEKEVYDIEVKDNHNFFANNILVHNCVYQEQVMKTVQVLGGFSLGGADLVRRAMGKKKKEVLEDLKGQFIEGTLKTYEGRSISYETLEHSAKEAESLIYMDKDKKLSFMKIKDFNVIHNRKLTKDNIGNFVAEGNFTIEDIPENEIVRVLADNLFEDIIKFAGYGFNKSHAYAYTNVSMKMANLKAHYPLEFFASIFVNNSDDVEKLATFIVDSKRNNIPLLGANINTSKKSFDIIENNIVYGLSIIKEVGDKDVKNIIKERDKDGEFNSFSDFLKRMKYSEHNIGNKTVENLILAGAFDDIIIDKEGLIDVRLGKISHDDNLSEDDVKILEEFFEKYEEKDQGLFFGLEDYSEKSFKERAIEIFCLEENIDLVLPMIYEKILNSTDEEIGKFMKNRKSFIKKFEKPVEAFLNFKHYIDIPDSDYLSENLHKKRALLIKIFNMMEINNITESILETLNIKELENSSLVYITEKEYELSGSTSSIGTLLENSFVLDKTGNQQALDFLSGAGTALKEEGDWRFAGVLKNIITGENSDGEFYCNLEIGDVNNITKKFYLSQSQIMRYRNNLEVGSVILLDLRVREGDEDKFYSTIDDIKFFKESENWEIKDALGKDTLRIDEHIDFDKIREDDIADIKPITLDELEVEWGKSINGWEGLQPKENKKVAFFLKGFKSITSKKSGKDWDIIEVGDGVGKKSLEMFYPKQDSDKLKEFRNMPIIIELQNKKENSKYGISPAYNSDIIFLDERYLLKDDEFNAKNRAISNINPVLDGANHINIYSKGKTELGRLLSNFSESPVEIEHKGEKITFKTVEGYWFFQKMYLAKGEEHFGFKDMGGLEAKKAGSSLTSNVTMDYNEEKMFRHYIIKAIVNKIANNSHLKDLLTSSDLPLAHYYVNNENVVELPQFNWIIDAISEIRDDFKSVAPAGEVKRTPYENLANATINIANINNGEEYDFYCGRAKKGQISPLGNPYQIDYNSHVDPEEQRNIVCDKYDRYLKKSMVEYNMKIEGAISNIVAFVEDEGEITLGCFCAPKRCHCESIREVVLDEIGKQLKRMPKPEKTAQKGTVISDIIAKYDEVREIDGYDLDLEEIPF